jgi:hypothetical protein
MFDEIKIEKFSFISNLVKDFDLNKLFEHIKYIIAIYGKDLLMKEC